MSTRARTYDAQVRTRERLSAHLVRLTLDVPGFVSSGIADEWVGLVVPGQFQSRYYTLRSVDGATLVLDVVLHEVGLVAEWVVRPDCVGSRVVVTEPKGSFLPAPDAQWLMLVGDLTAFPAMARIAEETALPTHVWASAPDPLEDYFPVPVTRVEEPLAEVVERIAWPEGEGYFWMAGESAQMRAIRKHLMRERQLPSTAYDVMGYWRETAGRQPRAVDPGPIWRAGKARGDSDEQIWAAYDEARS